MFECININIRDLAVRWEDIEMLSKLSIEFRSSFMDEETFPDLDEILKDLDDIGIQIFIQEYVSEDFQLYQVENMNLFLFWRSEYK